MKWLLSKCLRADTPPAADSETIRQLKNECKRISGNIDVVFNATLKALHQPSAKSRHSALHLLAIMFKSSRIFRDLVVDNLSKIIAQITANLSGPLSQELRVMALQTIKNWNENYSFKQLKMAYAQLEKQGIDFSHDAIHFASRPGTSTPPKIDLKEIKRQFRISQMELKVAEIIQQMNTCFNILVPLLQSLDRTPQTAPSTSFCETIRSAGLGSASYSLSLSIPSLRQHIPETPENKVVFETLRSCTKAAKKYHTEACTLGASSLKSSLESVLAQSHEIVNDNNLVLESDDDDGDENFEVVTTPSPPKAPQPEKEIIFFKEPLLGVPDPDNKVYETGFDQTHRGWIKAPDHNEPLHSSNPIRQHTPRTPIPTIQNKACRFMSSRGVLCGRRDGVCCPFHGVIIDRNEMGVARDATIADSELGMDRMEGRKMLWEVIAGDVEREVVGTSRKKHDSVDVKEELGKQMKKLRKS